MSTYTPIASQVLTASTASITFADIPQGYTDLFLVMRGEATSFLGNTMRFNNDSGSNYSTTRIYSDGSNATSDRFANETSLYISDIHTDHKAVVNLHIQNYSSPVKRKTVLTKSAYTGNMFHMAGLWRNNSAITSITLLTAGGAYASGCTFNLYGIAAGSAKAQGGEVSRDGTYFYHAFRSSSTFTVNEALTADVLVIAGGGGGGGDVSGGGGAGGILYKTSSSLTAQNYSIIIGAGGIGGNQSGTDPGTSGSDSYFDVLKAFGGGAGGKYDADGATGGSGGGGGGGGPQNGGASNQTSNNGGTGYGNAGGACVGTEATAVAGGGGGGAGAVGGNGNSNGGAGGAGLNTWSSWATATNTGSGGYYAGGGGAGGWNGSVGTGGSGGGGNGGARGDSQPAPAGTANTGGGGGGDGGGGGVGGAGGSGLVIVRYAI